MRIVSIGADFVERYGSGDREFMHKHGCPCIIVVRLKYRGRRRDFAVPLRSNISPNTPKEQYFALPPRPTTKPRHRHGIHFIKMFPVEKRYQQKFRIAGNPYYEAIQRRIDANERQIVAACQSYLDRYELEGRPRFAVDIDRIIDLLDEDPVCIGQGLASRP